MKQKAWKIIGNVIFVLIVIAVVWYNVGIVRHNQEVERNNKQLEQSNQQRPADDHGTVSQ